MFGNTRALLALSVIVLFGKGRTTSARASGESCGQNLTGVRRVTIRLQKKDNRWRSIFAIAKSAEVVRFKENVRALLCFAHSEKPLGVVIKRLNLFSIQPAPILHHAVVGVNTSLGVFFVRWVRQTTSEKNFCRRIRRQKKRRETMPEARLL